MKIRSHAESHIVELKDGSCWQIFPADLDLTLHWKPETDLELVRTVNEIGSHALVSDAGERVRVLPFGEKWQVADIKTAFSDGGLTKGPAVRRWDGLPTQR